jgi:phosphatidylethanolamine/phosphatidyl-N-methylethanolamine N-methyltransferase
MACSRTFWNQTRDGETRFGVNGLDNARRHFMLWEQISAPAFIENAFMSDTAAFIRNFLRQPGTIGAIAPSSDGLAQMMVDSVDWTSAKTVIEYGPGTGVFTEKIAKAMRPGTQFFAIEQSADLAELTRRRVPGVTVYQDSVANVVELCGRESIDQVDAVLCGLPWASFPQSLQQQCFDEMLKVLRPGGTFATFAYWQGLLLPAGLRFRKLLKQTFSEVKHSPTVFRNLPPAFVYRCKR